MCGGSRESSRLPVVEEPISSTSGGAEAAGSLGLVLGLVLREKPMLEAVLPSGETTIRLYLHSEGSSTTSGTLRLSPAATVREVVSQRWQKTGGSASSSIGGSAALTPRLLSAAPRSRKGWSSGCLAVAWAEDATLLEAAHAGGGGGGGRCASGTTPSTDAASSGSAVTISSDVSSSSAWRERDMRPSMITQ